MATPATVPPPPELLAELAKGFPQLPSLVTSDPPAHTQQRVLVAKALSLRRLAAFEPIIRGIAEELVDGFAASGRVELVEAFAIALPGNFIVDLLGLPREDFRQINRWMYDSTAIFAGRSRWRSSSSTRAAWSSSSCTLSTSASAPHWRGSRGASRWRC